MLETTKPQEHKILKWLNDNGLTQSFELFIERKDAYTRYVTGIYGWVWEGEFIKICKEYGFHTVSSDLNTRHDVLINGFKVQCKFSSLKNKIDLRNKDKNTQRKYLSSDLDFFAIRTISDYYIVPVSCLLEENLTFVKQSVKIDQIYMYSGKIGLELLKR